MEDEPLTAKVQARYVEAVDGFHVVGVAGTGRAALALVQRATVDLVLLDLGLPDLPGLEVARLLRAPGMPPVDVIVVSGVTDLDDVRTAMRHGAVQYLIKPVTLGALRDRLHGYRAALRKPAAQARSQADVDRLFEATYAVAAAPPKGIAPETLDAVLAALAASDVALSARELGERLGIGRVTARRYLEHLTATGMVAVQLRYGMAGRPEHEFCLARAASTEP